MNFIREWSSITNAAKSINLSSTSISANLKGKTNKSGKNIFKYKE